MLSARSVVSGLIFYPPGVIIKKVYIFSHTRFVGNAPSGVGEPGTPVIGPAVANALLFSGDIEPGRLKVQGFAETRPRAANDSVENRALNRRVEIIIDQTNSLLKFAYGLSDFAV